MEFVLIGLLGLGATWMIADMFDGNNGGDEDPGALPPEDVDQSFAVENGDTLDAGDGNDTITAADIVGPEMIVEIDAGSGDDIVDLSLQEDTDGGYAEIVVEGGEGNDVVTIASDYFGGANLSGGAGNDTLTGNLSFGLLIDGGSGDDVINGGGANSDLFGGDGDDIVTLENARGPEPGFASGGAGNDTMIYKGEITQEQFTSGGGLRGNDGDDVFQVFVTGVDAPITDPDDPAIGERAIIMSIGDFSVGNDRLVIDLSELPPGSAAYSEFEIVDGGSATEVVLRFDDGATGSIRLAGVTGLTAADITINP